MTPPDQEYGISRLTATLAGLGALPFVFGCLLLVLGVDRLPIVGSTVELLRSYTLAIVVFMCGIHWGQYVQDTRARDLNLLLLSNALTVICWLTFLVASFLIYLVIGIAIFLILLWVDYRLHKAGRIADAYFRMRLIVTVVVCLSLALVLGAGLSTA
jgi:hypothetical protein